MACKAASVLGVAVLALAIGLAPSANAAIIDLGLDTGGMFNGGLFVRADVDATGTGNIGTFVEIQSNNRTGVSEAYNTTVNGTLDVGPSDQHNHALLISSLNVTNVNGIDYYGFLLDGGEPGSDTVLSLDELQFYVSDTPNQSVETFTDPGHFVDLVGDMIYDMDADQDNVLLVDTAVDSGPGNGSGDVFFYLPVDAFIGTTGAYLYLYSQFGVTNDATGTFEEWASVGADDSPGVIPEPTSLSLIGVGLAGMAMRRYRRSR